MADETFRVKAGLPGSPSRMEVHPEEGDLRPWDLDSWASFRQVGKPHPRLEGALKVTGRAKYTHDVRLPGMLHGRMIGAAVPAGEIVSIDTSRAEALPGVRAVWKTEARTIRFAGQDVAAVAAVSKEVAEDAARLVKVVVEDRPFTTELRDAMREGAPLVYPGGGEAPEVPRKGNVVGPRNGRRGGGRGDVDKGFREAEIVVEKTYHVPVHTHATLETHGVVAAWEGNSLTVYASTQGVFSVREGLAEALGIDRKNVRVITEHMGGGFGSKLGPSASGSAFAVVACKLAKQAGAPVKLMLDRKQEQLCTGNAPSALMTVKLGAKKDGTITALRYVSYGSAGIAPGAGTAGPAGTLYQDNPNFAAEEYDVYTNAGPAAPLRAPGHPQGAFALESAIDELADALGMDPLALRKKNESSPVRAAQYDLGAQAIGWDRRNKAPGQAQGKRAKVRGLGMANGNWYVIAREHGMGARVRIHRDGSVELFSGAQDIGTGFRTAIAVVAAEELGIEPDAISVLVGDTRYPEGPGSGGSNTTNTVAPVVRLAASRARAKLFEAAAPALGAKPEDLAARDGKVFVAKDPARSLPFKEAASRMPGEVIDETAERKRQFETYRRDIAGTQFAEVEVDTETGEVRVLGMVSVNDCGFPVNALTAESQVIGAMIQGASWALLEHRILDPVVGTMVNPNLESYKIFSPSDMFEARAILTPVANMGNNTSAAGLGEPPMVPSLAAIANAVANATGARVRELPITPDRVLAALAQARRRA